MESKTGSSKSDSASSCTHADCVEMVDLTDSSSATVETVISSSSSTTTTDSEVGASKYSLINNILHSNKAPLTWNDDTDIPNGKWSERCCIESNDSCLTCCFCCECNLFCQPCRRCVSTNKVRWEKEGFSIDLTYISPRVITHGFPSAGIEHIYRNPRYIVKRFLDEKHGKHYHVFNFCAEPGRCYPKKVFEGRIRRFPFRDHQVPRLYVLHKFIECAVAWLAKDERNVCALHCKAGKGRAGVMACCLLLRIGFKTTAKDMIAHYDKTRVTMKKSGRQKGLTVPSQLRYVGYYESLLRLADNGTINPALLGKPTPRHINFISLQNGPDNVHINVSLYQQVGFVGEKEIRWKGSYTKVDQKRNGWVINEGNGIELEGNFEIVFTIDNPENQKEKRVGYTWMNTGLHSEDETVVLQKCDIDKFHKDRKHKKYHPDLKVILKFGSSLGLLGYSNPMNRKHGEPSQKTEGK
jgi:phosphatidylinositol-3,4,5-trisphosphate 3-phosphatase/dual-specificity protein phosphatase PTEN